MNRALRAAIVGVALFSPIALAGCSAGQVTQTATQQRDKVGAMVELNEIVVRQVVLAYPSGGFYEAGDDAELEMAIVNVSLEPDVLLAVDGEGFAAAEISGVSSDTTTNGVPEGETPVRVANQIEIAPNTTVFVGSGNLRVTLLDLDEPLTTGQFLNLTLTFQNAGEVTVPATVATPSRELERGESFDFHHSEGEHG